MVLLFSQLYVRPEPRIRARLRKIPAEARRGPSSANRTTVCGRSEKLPSESKAHDATWKSSITFWSCPIALELGTGEISVYPAFRLGFDGRSTIDSSALRFASIRMWL
jgi:hypothetical protein